jgi:hypothetical protein
MFLQRLLKDHSTSDSWLSSPTKGPNKKALYVNNREKLPIFQVPRPSPGQLFLPL